MIKIEIEKYYSSVEILPTNGQHIIAHQAEGCMVVYQAYKKSIADFAVKNQYLGGAEFSYNRMSWIKPNFLWMMFRCGWAEKENQEHVLALWVERTYFEKLLAESVISSFDKRLYDNHEPWWDDLDKKEARLQWDPDHDPYGNKISRRAIQIGLKGKTLEEFGKRQIKLVEDITNFVKEQSLFVKMKQLESLLIPKERIFKPTDEELCKKVGIE